MNLLVPAALAFALIIPIILVFYFMRPKRQEQTIGSTLLWQQALQDLQASRPWQRLRVTPLLLLQLLAAAFIVLVLARPAVFSSSPVSGDTIILLQSSASMQATDVAPSRFESAKSQIADFIDTLGSNDHLALITMARTPQVLIAQSQNKNQLHKALERAKVTNQNADLQQALSLATSLAAGQPHMQLLVVGDGHVLAPDQTLDIPFPVRYLRIGTDAPNAALLALASRNVQGNLTALAQVANYSHQQRSIPVELYADGKLVNVQTITLPAGASSAVQWGPLAPQTRFLHARLASQDVMSADHEAWAIVGGSLYGRALLVTKGNTFLESALRLQPTLNLYETTPTKYSPTDTYDLTIFDDFAPKTLPVGDLFFVNPPTGSYIFGQVGPQLHVSHIATDNDTLNLLSAVDVSSIRVLRASHQLTPALWAQSILISPETPLLLAGQDNNRRVAVLGFDLHDSDLPLQPAFPIMVFNMVNWFLPQPVAGTGQAMVGAPLTLQTWPGADQVTVTSPDKQATLVGPPFPVSPYTNTNQIGLYQVAQHVHGQDLQGTFAVNLFNPSQSQLAPAKRLPITHSTNFTSDPNSVPRELREIWPWVAAFLLLTLCFEWWLFSRNYKPQSTAPLAGKPTKRRTTPPILQPLTTALQTVKNNKDYKKFVRSAMKATQRFKHTPPLHKVKKKASAKGNRHANI